MAKRILIFAAERRKVQPERLTVARADFDSLLAKWENFSDENSRLYSVKFAAEVIAISSELKTRGIEVHLPDVSNQRSPKTILDLSKIEDVGFALSIAVGQIREP